MFMASDFDMLHLHMEPQYPFAYWVIFHGPVVVCSLFSKFFNKILNSNTVNVSNGLNPDQDGRSVRPFLGPNCL